MTFDSLEVLDEFSYKTSEYSSTSLYVEDGYKLLLLTGHIENTGTTAFSDSSFFRTCVVNDSYTVTDYDVRLSFKRDYCIRDLFTPEADYDNGYTYKGFAVTDKDDNSFTWASSYVVCTPLETCHYHGLVECPKVVDGSDAPLIVTLNIGGQVYTYTIR